MFFFCGWIKIWASSRCKWTKIYGFIWEDVGETISVLLEKIEDKHGEVLVSASKAQKIKGWDKLVEAYEKNEPIMGKLFLSAKVDV